MTTAVSPPASQYPDAISPFSSSDLSENLWIASTTVQVEAAGAGASFAELPANFYVRSLNGPLSEVGPVLPSPLKATRFARDYFDFRGASSSNLSRVLFSMKEEHWPGDTTALGDESLYEYVGTGNQEPLLVGVSGGEGSTHLISKCGTSLAGAGEITATRYGVSEDGNKVLFVPAVCGSSPAVSEIYARVDNGLADAHTVSVSEPSGEDCSVCDVAKGVRQNAVAVGMSRDGSRVLFLTSQQLLGGDSSNNLYEYDFAREPGQRIVRVSGGDSTVSNPTAGVESVVNLSPDGSHVYFYASGVLTRTPDALGQEAQVGQSNLYLYERDAQYPDGRTVFVLPHVDVSGVSYVSQNGRFVVFGSAAHLTPDDLSSVAQEFEYDSVTGGVVRVSVGQDGYNQNGNTGSVRNAMVADDGAVYFESENPLVPQAVNGVANVYEYREGNLALISDGQDTHSGSSSGGGFLDYISPSGTDVFFTTYDRLVARDTDDQEDLYDARVGGGFVEQVSPPPCEGDSCQGPLARAPVLLSPGSEFQAGGENLVPSITESSTVAKSKPKPKPKPKPRHKARKRRRGTASGRKREGAGVSGRVSRGGGRS
ncbi:MAG: hypothetical protein WA484_05440 [Solirubrobacteraceae bacterium]